MQQNVHSVQLTPFMLSQTLVFQLRLQLNTFMPLQKTVTLYQHVTFAHQCCNSGRGASVGPSPTRVQGCERHQQTLFNVGRTCKKKKIPSRRSQTLKAGLGVMEMSSLFLMPFLSTTCTRKAGRLTRKRFWTSLTHFFSTSIASSSLMSSL